MSDGIGKVASFGASASPKADAPLRPRLHELTERLSQVAGSLQSLEEALHGGGSDRVGATTPGGVMPVLAQVEAMAAQVRTIEATVERLHGYV